MQYGTVENHRILTVQKSCEDLLSLGNQCRLSVTTDMLPSRLGLQNTLTAHLQRGKNAPTIVLDMTLNNLIVRFQQCWSFGECGVPLYCHCSQVHSGPDW